MFLGEIIAVCLGHRRKQTKCGVRPTYCNHSAEVAKKFAKLSG